jgi:cellulose synthase/poly-beta-1,6-N-acetylglucosamine synthase-like glycosyltransferase
MITEIIFWSSIGFVFYAYFGYLLLLMILNVFRNRPIKKENITPKVSFVIAAHNEGERIAAKIENTLGQEYPEGKLEILVASDCSTDGTDAIARSFESRGVKLVRAPERRGKENAQKLGVDAASGEIMVFSDVATVLDPDGVHKIIKNFHDRAVGCVSSIDRFINPDGKISGEGAYIGYEMFLRGLETKVNSLVSVSGSFFAARREVCKDWAVDLQSDFNTVLNSVKLGLRGVLDQEAVGYYTNIVDEDKEFDRKVRTVLRGISVMARNPALLNPLKYGLFSWQLFSHKGCRWLVPLALLLALISNAFMLWDSLIFLVLFVLQITFYCLALAYSKSRAQPGNKKRRGNAGPLFLRVPHYFVSANVSILLAWLKYFRGERATYWEPSRR